MNWTRFKDRKPNPEEIPSGRILVAVYDLKHWIYMDWGVRSPAIDSKFSENNYWMAIPLLPSQSPFWWR